MWRFLPDQVGEAAMRLAGLVHAAFRQPDLLMDLVGRLAPDQLGLSRVS